MTTIDLCKPEDVKLVYRAVVNGWDVPQSIRDQITAQLSAALTAAQSDPSESRRPRRIAQLGKLMERMEARNMIAEGHPKSTFPSLRNPEKRLPKPRYMAKE